FRYAQREAWIAFEVALLEAAYLRVNHNTVALQRVPHDGLLGGTVGVDGREDTEATPHDELSCLVIELIGHWLWLSRLGVVRSDQRRNGSASKSRVWPAAGGRD